MLHDLKRRLKQLEVIIRPSHGLRARLDKLTPVQAATFQAYRERYDRWAARHAGENLYAAMIDDPPPRMSSALRAVLFPNHHPPLEGDSLNVISEKYRSLLEECAR